MKDIYLDSDVILDVTSIRESTFLDSLKVFDLMEKGEISCQTSTLVIANIYYHLKKFFGHQLAISFITDLLTQINLLNTTKESILKALNSDFKDFEDAIQYFCALENGIDCIITRNKKDFSYSHIPVYTPTEFNEYWEKYLEENITPSVKKLSGVFKRKRDDEWYESLGPITKKLLGSLRTEDKVDEKESYIPIEMPQEITEYLNKIVKSIKDTISLTTIYLFGSYATGDYKENSDIDIYIVTPDRSKRLIEHEIEVSRAIGYPRAIAIDIVVGYEEDFEKRSKLFFSLEQQVVKSGVVLYAS